MTTKNERHQQEDHNSKTLVDVPMKKVAIVQSSYIPWKGFFDIINQVDEFLLFDQVQYTRRDWRNRNRIKSKDGLKWLSVPVDVKGNYTIPIEEVQTCDDEWRKRHWNLITQTYAKSPCFNDYKQQIADLYLGSSERTLSKINYDFIDAIMRILGIGTKLRWSTDYGRPEGSKSDLLVSICKLAGATSYLSGPSASSYIDEAKFSAEGIDVSYVDYAGYPEYSQPFPPFSHEVTVLDLIFSCGAESREYIWGARRIGNA